MYSVMADTTPDVSHKDRLAIACRYVDKIGQPRERLVSLTEAKDKTGEGGATEIIESLTEQGLDLDVLCFQSYDYTASMSGRFNGVQKKLQDKLGKSVPYIPCLAHRSNTVIEQPRTQGLLGSKARNEEGPGKLWSHDSKNFGHYVILSISNRGSLQENLY